VYVNGLYRQFSVSSTAELHAAVRGDGGVPRPEHDDPAE
jgi:hypothetical protein